MNVYSHSSANDYSLNTIEYLVKKKSDSKIYAKRFLIIFISLIVAAPITFIAFNKVPVFVPIIVLLTAYFIKISWSLTCLEYEYTIVQGELTMDVIIGARKRKTLTSFIIREAEVIKPYDQNVPADAKIINACISPNDKSTWYALYKDENGNRVALLFSAYDKALDIMSYYNRQAVSNQRIKDGSAE